MSVKGSGEHRQRVVLYVTANDLSQLFQSYVLIKFRLFPNFNDLYEILAKFRGHRFSKRGINNTPDCLVIHVGNLWSNPLRNQRPAELVDRGYLLSIIFANGCGPVVMPNRPHNSTNHYASELCYTDKQMKHN